MVGPGLRRDDAIMFQMWNSFPEAGVHGSRVRRAAAPRNDGVGRKCVSPLAPSNPLAVDRVLAADELDIGRATRRIDVERPPQGRDDLGWSVPITFDMSTSSGPSTRCVKGSCPGPQKPGP